MTSWCGREKEAIASLSACREENFQGIHEHNKQRTSTVSVCGEWLQHGQCLRWAGCRHARETETAIIAAVAYIVQGRFVSVTALVEQMLPHREMEALNNGECAPFCCLHATHNADSTCRIGSLWRSHGEGWPLANTTAANALNCACIQIESTLQPSTFFSGVGEKIGGRDKIDRSDR